MKISPDQRWYYSYPDPVSAEVQRRFLANGRRLPTGFTGFLSREERALQGFDSEDRSHPPDSRASTGVAARRGARRDQ